MVKNDSFCESSVSALGIIRLCAFIDFLLFLICSIFLYTNLLPVIIMLAACLVTLIAAVLRQLIKTGIALKEEIELTI